MIEHYFTYDKESHIVNHTPISVLNGSLMAEYPSTALTVQPLPEKEGSVVMVCDFDEHGKPHSTLYLQDYRDKAIWNQSDCTQSKQVSDLGDIEDGWTLLKPTTEFDEWIDGLWVTNLSNQYIFNYNQVDDARRRVYITVINPLELEAQRKERQGETAIAEDYYRQADAAKVEMEKAHPWPVQPT
ncbi:hypothetical protein OTK51_04550 [Vibrio scophthalmi]|uniref:hypothetical protein n=1 Tax=Vibrio scophthalmi TaxID=45658 RepID=UPI002285188E|nr:hypothetical protein [Vibrio scophthalmi]MCY9802698.1 hypothetical protein [Vibrio scophthalmi]